MSYKILGYVCDFLKKGSRWLPRWRWHIDACVSLRQLNQATKERKKKGK